MPDYKILSGVAKDKRRVTTSSFEVRRRYKDEFIKEKWEKEIEPNIKSLKKRVIPYKEILDIDNGEIYEWYMLGSDKYGREMYCIKTHTFRTLTMGEFYENSIVD